ncbi:MAG: M48 family metallopeptidase [Aeoliella sp.]
MRDVFDGLRFIGDTNGAQALLEHEEISPFVKRHEGQAGSDGARKGLLSDAVRVDAKILPSLGEAIDDLHSRVGLSREFECYVSAHPMINAGVFSSGEKYTVVLSSAAVENLAPDELAFVIGHELGHVTYNHSEIPVNKIVEAEPELAPKQAIELFAWKRQAEISADRVGMICCGSLDTAASAFFKTISGLSAPTLRVNPLEFADQFDHLKQELHRQGAEEMWTISHPLPPLRAKAMALFWETDEAKQVLPKAPGGNSLAGCDEQVESLLAYMDPRARRGKSGVDPMLEPFLTWGGLYVAGCDGKVDKTELDALRGVIGSHAMDHALQAPKNLEEYLKRFQSAVDNRDLPLSALDLHRVLECFVAIVRADGVIEDAEITALKKLAKIMGVAEGYALSLLEDNLT